MPVIKFLNDTDDEVLEEVYFPQEYLDYMTELDESRTLRAEEGDYIPGTLSDVKKIMKNNLENIYITFFF